MLLMAIPSLWLRSYDKTIIPSMWRIG